MKKKILEVKELFNSFYKNTYRLWRIENKKAAKDIVGEEYENFRKKFYEKNNVEISTRENVLNSGINFDIVIRKKDKIYIIEECKGSYVDSPFLKRSIFDFAVIIDLCLQKNIDCPYFILSSSTKMKNFEDCYKKFTKILKDDIRIIMDKKFLYLPICEHGRVKREIYFKNPENNFVLSENLIQDQIIKINKILK